MMPHPFRSPPPHTHTHTCTKHTATEIADLNIMSTRLSSQLSPLRQKASELSGQLAQLQCEVVGKREERERRVGREWTDTQTELLKLKRELDVSPP